MVEELQSVGAGAGAGLNRTARIWRPYLDERSWHLSEALIRVEKIGSLP